MPLKTCNISTIEDDIRIRFTDYAVAIFEKDHFRKERTNRMWTGIFKGAKLEYEEPKLCPSGINIRLHGLGRGTRRHKVTYFGFEEDVRQCVPNKTLEYEVDANGVADIDILYNPYTIARKTCKIAREDYRFGVTKQLKDTLKDFWQMFYENDCNQFAKYWKGNKIVSNRTDHKPILKWE